METTIWGLGFSDNGKENGNYYSILGLFRDNGKGKGAKGYIGLYRDYRVYIGVI